MPSKKPLISSMRLFVVLQVVFAAFAITVFPSKILSQVTLEVGEGSGLLGSDHNPVEVSLENPDHLVKGVQVDICDENDYLAVSENFGCEISVRTSNFNCIASELENGCVRVVLVSFAGDFIEEGSGPIFTLSYDVQDGLSPDACVTLSPENAEISDEFGNPLSGMLNSGQFCFSVCGDVYPRGSFSDTGCGDGAVNIFDVLEEIGFLLGLDEPSTCQMLRADVPNGMPPECFNQNGLIDLFDLVVIVDMSLDKNNCCED